MLDFFLNPLVPVVLTWWILLVHKAGFVKFLLAISLYFAYCVTVQLPLWHLLF